MSRTLRLFAATVLGAGALVPGIVRAAAPRPVACTVTVSYLLNDSLRATYQKDFVVTPDAPFSDDFSNAVRFGFFDASSQYDAAAKATTVTMSFFHDVSALEFVDLRTRVVARDDRTPASSTGSSTYWSSLGVAGEHTTDYEMTCQVAR